MKMNTFHQKDKWDFSKLFPFFMLLLFTFPNSLHGQVRKSFTPRLSVDAGNKTLYNIKGDFTMLGNTNLTLKDYLDNRDNSSNSMIYVDVDRDGSTANSSSADLVFSTENGADASCTEIVYAGLYWTGRVDGKGDSPFNVNTTQLIVNKLNGAAQQWTNGAVPYTNANLSIVREGGSFNRSPVYTFTVGTWNLKIKLTNSSTNRAEVDVNGAGYQPLAGNYNTGTGEFVLISPESYEIGNSTIKIVSLRRNTSTSGSNGDYTTAALNYANVELTGDYFQNVASTTSLDKTKVKFKAPGMTNYVDIVAKPGDINFPGDNDMYAAYADVTNYVKAGKTGTYFVGNVASLEGNGGTTGYYGGWGIVVVYKNDKMKWRDIAVFDGYAYVIGGIGSNELPISGFQATQEGDVKVKLGVMAGEGDVGITGDYLKIQRKVGNTTSWFDLSHSGNTTTNFFNSSILTGGNARNPLLKNNTGMDIAMFDIPNADKSIIANKATSTVLQYGSTQDTYIIFSLVFGVDAYVPEVEPVNGLVSVNGSPVTGTPVVVPGDVLEYEVQIKNKGTEGIENTKVTIPIPYTASFVSAGLTGVVAPGVTGNTIPRYDPLNGALGAIVWDIGTLPLPANPETVLATLTYRLKVTEDCFLLTNPNCTPTVAVHGLVTGIGQTTKATVGTSGEFISGFTGAGTCVGQPVRNPISLTVNTAGHCQDYSYQVLDIVFCESVSNATILAQVRDKFPAGTRFYDNNTGTGQNTEYDESRPFPTNTPNKVFYALPPGATGCFYEFKIKITSIQNKPTVAAQPVVYCVNEEAVALTAVATDASYSLYYYTAIDGQGKPVGNASTSIIPNTSTVGSTIYYVTQGTALCQSEPSAITVQVLANPVIATDLQNLTLCAETNGTMTVSLATAIPSATYVWQIESGGNWIALNNAAFTIDGATLNVANIPLTLHGTKVRVVISNGKCSIISAVATITVNKPTAITTSPLGTVYCKDEVATALTVIADGTGTLNYQWFSNTSNSTTGGTAISGETSASYTPATGVVGTYYYYVVVGGACGTGVTSEVATITVNKPTAITTSPLGTVYCKDEVATALTVEAAGTGTLTYQWFSNTTNSTTGGTPISGATSASYTPATDVVGTYYYYVVVGGACGTGVTSEVATITVNKPTAITTSPVDAIYCKDEVATALTVEAEGTGTLTYQWFSNTSNSTTGGTPISTATTASYTPATDIVGTYYYYVVVGGACGAGVTSEVATITVNKPTAITTSPVDAIYCKDEVATALTVEAEGTGTLTYQWFSNTSNSTTGGTPISTATTASYTPATNTVGTYYYYVVVGGACGTGVTSEVATITVNKLTAITTSPVDAIYCKDKVATALTVEAAGTGTLTYQWFSNTTNSTTGGTAISGETSASYTPTTNTAVGTYYYYVVVGGACGTGVTSEVATITVNKPTAITTSPVGAVYCKDEVATALTVIADGTGTLNYQWFSNTTNSTTGGTAISTATTASYTPATNTVSTYYYYVVVGGACGTGVTSEVATITVNKPTAITTSPVDAIYCKDEVATALTVEAAGTGTLTYQWFSNTTNSTTGGTAISTATTASYTPATNTVGTYYYYVVVGGACGTGVTSEVATITVNKPTAITTSPVDAIYCKDEVATALTVEAAGTGTLTYQWFSNTTNSTTGGTAISGETSASYTPVTNTVGTYYYYVVVGGACGTGVTSEVATITVNKLTAITTSPVDAIYCKDEVPTALTVEAEGTGTLTYQWFSNTSNSTTGGTPISTATTASYTPATDVVGTYYYYVVVGGACGTGVTSEVATITVNKLTAITTSPVDAIYCKDEVPTALTVEAEGTGILTYQWYSNTANSTTGGTAISSATTASYTPTTGVVGTYYYYVVVTGSCGTAATSAVATIGVNKLTAITTSPVDAIYCKDEVATALTVEAAGTGTLNYQWFSNTSNSTTGGTPISSATTASYTPATDAVGTQYYYVVVGSECGAAVTSAIAAIMVNKPTLITSSPTEAVYCKDGTATALIVIAEGTGTLTYQWFSNTSNSTTGGTPISSATTASYTPATGVVGTYYYYVVVGGACGTGVTSEVATITVNKLTAITTSPVGTVYCKDEVATALTVEAEGTGTLTYQWYSNTNNSTTDGTAISTATTASYTPATDVVGTYYYYVVVGGTCGTGITSEVATITVNKLTAITTSPVDAIYCKDEVATALTVIAEGTGTLNYQWFSNTNNSTTGGTAISSATSASYTPATDAVGTQYYYVVVGSECGAAVTSAIAAIMVNKPTLITSSPTEAVYCKDGTATALTVIAEGTGTLNYQWFSNTNNSTTGGTPISTATTASYTPAIDVVGTQYYYVIVQGDCGADVRSTPVAIVVNKPTVVVISPASAVYCEGVSAAALSVIADGTGTLTYQWYRNTSNSTTGGVLIEGATAATYVPTSTDAGINYYYVKVTGACGETVSAIAAIQVNATPPAPVTRTMMTYIGGADLAYDAVALPNHSLTWYTDIHGNGSRSINNLVKTNLVGEFTAYVSQTNNETLCTSPIVPVKIIIRAVGITVTKSVDQENIAKPELLTYTIKVTNTGNFDLTDVKVVDELTQMGLADMPITAIGAPVESLNSDGILEEQEVWTYKFTYKVDQERIDNGNLIVNTVSVTAKEIPNAVTDMAQTTIAQSAGIAIVKRHGLTKADEQACYTLKVGDIVPYHFAVSNVGNVSLSNIELTDALAGVSKPMLISGDTNGNNKLDVDEVWNYTASYSVRQADLDAGKISNQATASGVSPSGTLVSDLSGDAVGTNNPTVFDICAVSNLVIEKLADRNEVTKVGEEIHYKLKVRNSGNTLLKDIVVTDILFNDWSRKITTLAPNEEVIIDLVYKVTSADFDKGQVRNIAHVEGKDPREVPIKEESPAVIIPVKYLNKLYVEKTALSTQVSEVGKVIEYEIVVRNDGNQVLNKVIVVDPLTGLNRTIEKLEVGETVKITTNYTVTGEDFKKTEIENIVNVTAKNPQGVDVTGTDNAIVKVVPNNFKIPNVFTPNGDGINDRFELIGVERFDHIEIIVINRWGNEVYKNERYQNNWTGEGLNNGTYYYIIHTVNGGERTPYKGWVLIKK